MAKQIKPLVSYPPLPYSQNRLLELLTREKKDAMWLAAFLSVTPLTARRIIHGKDLSLTQAQLLAKYFKVTIENLFGEPA